jgi:V/A-type H+-transporting ATPase subunit C
MIASVFKYSYPNAKVRALKGSLLTTEHFYTLLQTNSYREFLTNLHASPYLQAIQEEHQDLTLPALTTLLYANLFQDYVKIIHALNGDLQKLFILIYQRYELTNLKTVLRGLSSQVPSEEIAPLLLPTERYLLFSKEELLALRNVHDVIDHLQDSFFQYPLNRALPRFEKEHEFFPLEMSLDLHYYRTLWDTIQTIGEPEREIIRTIIGMLIDVLNVSWIIRFKEHYQFSPEEILNYTIHHGHVFRLRDRRKLAEAQGSAEIIAHLQQSPYGKMLSGDESLQTLHIVLARYVMAQLAKYFQRQPFQIGVILGYLYLKEFEVSDLLTIAEAKKYEYSFEDTQQYVIHA